MTTITIKKATNLRKTEFEDLEELRDFLGEETNPVEIRLEPLEKLPTRVRRAYGQLIKDAPKIFRNL